MSHLRLRRSFIFFSVCYRKKIQTKTAGLIGNSIFTSRLQPLAHDRKVVSLSVCSVELVFGIAVSSLVRCTGSNLPTWCLLCLTPFRESPNCIITLSVFLFSCNNNMVGSINWSFRLWSAACFCCDLFIIKQKTRIRFFQSLVIIQSTQLLQCSV